MFVRSLRSAIAPARTLAVRAPVPAYSAALRVPFRYNSSSSSSTSSSSPSPSTPVSTPSTAESSADPSAPAIDAPSPGSPPTKQQVGQIEPRLAMTFTCTAGPEKGNPVCGHRSTHEFSKRSYTQGIVLVQCPECKARHLIADHLGWFKEVTEDGKHRTVEDLMRAKGEQVKKGRVTMDGDIEYVPDDK